MKLNSTDNILEVAVHSLESALAAKTGGADRIEVCTALQTGGLTPDLGLLECIRDAIDLPIHVLIRPRLGNFVYDQYEIKTMVHSIEVLIKSKVQGIVIGCLKHDGHLDQRNLQLFKEVAGTLDITFHRAIDVCQNMFDAVEIIMETGYNRILTSGAAPSAWEGRSRIRQMVEIATGSQLSIMPGAGVLPENAAALLKETGAREIHASAKKVYPLIDHDSIGLTTIHGKAVVSKWESDAEQIESIKKAISHS